MMNKNAIPNGWEVKKLGEILNFVGGGTPDKSNKDFWNGNIPWASVKDIKGTYLTQTQDKITNTGLSNSSAQLAQAGEVILITRIYPGKTVIAKIETAINQDLKIIKPKTDIEIPFIHYLFQTIEKEIIKNSSGTTVLGIRLEKLKEIEIPLPPLSEQQEIVAKIEELLSELDQGKQQLETTRQQLKVYRQAVLKWAFEGKLTNAIQNGQKTQEGELPEGWKWAQPVDIALQEKYSIGIGPFGSNLKTSDYKPEGIPLIFVKNITRKNFDLDKRFISEEKFNELHAHQVKPGDILITKMGDPPGDCTIYPLNRNPAVLTADCLKLRVNESAANSTFIKYCFESKKVKRQIEAMTVGVAQKKISVERFKSLVFPLPTLKEQNQIVQEIESRLSVCDKVEETITQTLQQAETLRQSILKQAFEGKLVKAGKTVVEMA
jgi:type I restriction enzyme S subunit